MKINTAQLKDIYYTPDHEWISFQGSIAFAGVAPFKLTGFKEIREILFHRNSGFVTKGERVATIRSEEYTICVHMPVDGKIVAVNSLLNNNRLLLEQPESNGWIAQIIPFSPYNREGLLLPKAYQPNGKSKYAKG